MLFTFERQQDSKCGRVCSNEIKNQ